ncbi:hypothetical protein DMN91_007595 [Ooceraea biroi]|uniref:Coiled-coil domain-containing protein n=1 Tax=Ooceraea biroi TaxID=2015173 RepID=A0A026X3N0_OOCBI|nr:coiled-coil domain-containing protein 51 [Ooceraea biroi]EZA62683.1 Coiled-coil domain-containing protein [Ooceraea biroi]RLU20979.1 hypothetical protein DMN91_007595 [Ooceraea biroi]
MTENYRHLIKLVREQVKRFQVLQNAKGIVKGATEKTQNNFSTAQNIAEKYNNIIGKRLNDQIAIMQDLNAKALKANTPLPENIVKWWHWYNRLTGLDSVEMSKRQVIDLQNKLFECQDKRRTLNKNMTDITHTLQHIYGELVQTKRDDPKYVNLTIMENKNLQEQKKIIDELALSEVEERDKFTQLATAIKEYHDSQNLNATKYKYLSILASAVIAIVSLIGSIILNNRRILDVRNTIKTMQEENKALFQTNTNQLSSLTKVVRSIESTFSQTPANKDKRREDKSDNNASDTSNIILRSAMYPVHLLVSGAGYMKKGIYAGGSYVVKFFY